MPTLTQLEECPNKLTQTYILVLSSNGIEWLLSEVVEINRRARELDSYATVDEVNELKDRLEEIASERVELVRSD